jgi:hypothetical protein
VNGRDPDYSRAQQPITIGFPSARGGRCVRFNDRVFEAIHAVRQHRQRCDLCPLLTSSGSRYMR